MLPSSNGGAGATAPASLTKRIQVRWFTVKAEPLTGLEVIGDEVRPYFYSPREAGAHNGRLAPED